jgi:hypothetical protein
VLEIVMRLMSILLVVIGIGVGMATAYIAANHASHESTPDLPSGEFASGPPVGSKLPGTFEPLNINGPDAGTDQCIVCKYLNSPVVMVFARQPGPAVANLVAKLEQAAQGAKRSVGACVVFTDTNDSTQAQLKKLADEKSLRQVVLGVINASQLKSYRLHPDADCTVIFYDKQVIRVNRAFKTGEFTATAADEVAKQAADYYAAY